MSRSGPSPRAAGVTSPPESLGLNPFYRKYLDAKGIPIIGSDKVPDRAFQVARDVVLPMLSMRPDLHQQMVDIGTRVAIIAESEQFLDIPEHKILPEVEPRIDWNNRCRGMGACGPKGFPDIRVCSAAEENILRYPTETHCPGESVLVHEFAHTAWALGIQYLDPPFWGRVEVAYQAAVAAGLWKDSYAGTNAHEYWAVGTCCWFNAHKERGKPGGQACYRDELLQYDPRLAQLISEWFPSGWKWSRTGRLIRRER
jgi:hypothetical protein